MLNYNNKGLRQSLQRTKKSQKSIHTASINLKEPSTSEAFYLPLRQVLNRKISDNGQPMNASSKNKQKVIDRSIYLMDKSFSASKKSNKENLKADLRHDKSHAEKQSSKPKQPRFKLTSRDNKAETDRKSLQARQDKSAKSIRLKTDYNDIVASHQNLKDIILSNKQQVSTKHTQQDKCQQNSSSNVVHVDQKQLMRIFKQFKKLQENNKKLKRELAFYQHLPHAAQQKAKEKSKKYTPQVHHKNSILKALEC